MKNALHIFYAVVLAIVSVYTKEIVTFVMLGFILMSLTSINHNLKNLNELMKVRNQNKIE